MEICTRRLLCSLILIVAVSVAYAAPVYHPPGSNLSAGDVSNGQSIISDITNPAASAVQLKNDGAHVQFGLISNIGIGFEYGQVDNVFDIIDEKAEAYSDGLRVTVPAFTGNPTNPGDVSQYIADIQQAIDIPVADINNVLATVAADGYGKVFGSMNLPLTPVVVGNDFLAGVLVFDASVSVATKAVGLYDSIDIDFADVQAQLLSGNTVLDLGEVDLDLSNPSDPLMKVTNDTTLLTRAAGVSEFALGYSRQLFRHEAGDLFGGLRAKYYRVGMAQAATRLGNLTDAEQLFQDARDAPLNYDSNFGLDLGVLWVSENYRLGATLMNLNAPTFRFSGLNVSGYSDGPIAHLLAQDYVYKMETQLKLEAALFSSNRQWAINAGLDANAVPDPFSDDYQWATLSAAYLTDSWWIPGARIGYRANLAGENMNYATLGATLFKVFNIDLARALNTVTIDGSRVPRGAMLNMGLELSF
ncbi:MAG: conjugal transfer protein TraF [Gammaproteobacteria bacterium]|nr:conjugal transfer protein TraF [Gammaproteobacteria bacterium]MCF6363025.1 conjugal transfer protein TraF [Gammaproteobacteria bacterium]